MIPNDRNEEERIQRLMEELPISMQTPNEFKSKLIDRAVAAKSKPRPVRRPAWVAVMTAGIATVALGAYFMSPKPAMGKTWLAVREAIEQITSFKMSVVTTEGGQRKTEAVITVSDEGILIEAEQGEIVYMDGKSMQVYDPKENTVTHLKMMGIESTIKEAVKTGVVEGLGAISLKDVIAEMEKDYGKENIKIGPSRTENGRQVFDVFMRNPKNGLQGSITVDEATNKPFRIISEELSNGAKVINEITLEYNGRFNLKPTFPKDAKYEEVDFSKLMQGHDFGDSKGNSGGGTFHFSFGDDEDKPKEKASAK
ncbi:MAG: hypothetical protein KF784_10775 [Fimbriimonadaceae bacterium]|nr:hypothetical protein [Fimbriimonadaceae bacterium]